MNTVKSSYLFPNGMVVTFDWNGEQMQSLQGEYTRELHENIIKYSDEGTILNGFPELTNINQQNKRDE